MTDASGKLYEHIEYFPFGETWVQEHSNTQRTPYLFTGKELDEETQLYYFGARYYDPRTSVWQSADPAFGIYLPPAGSSVRALKNRGVYNPNNLALYSYTNNNPIIFTDPNGLAPTKVHGEMVLASANQAGFSPAAARDIAFANMSVDTPGHVTRKDGQPPEAHVKTAAISSMSFWASMFNDKAHGTGDIRSMPKSSAHIDDLVDQAVNAALGGKINEARTLLGQATHTAEDQPFHQGINVFKHILLSIADFITGGLFGLDPDKVTQEKKDAGIANDKQKVFDPFSARLRETAATPEAAAKADAAVKGNE